MKVFAVFVASLAAASAFAPAQTGRVETSLAAEEKKPFFNSVFGMDLWTPVKDQNDYGARNKKNLKVAKLGSNSYVPAGLSAAEYQKIRDRDEAKKNANYSKNVAKAFKFTDFTQWYLNRGTSEGGKWLNAPGLGHTFAKTKYDYSGGKNEQKSFDGRA